MQNNAKVERCPQNPDLSAEMARMGIALTKSEILFRSDHSTPPIEPPQAEEVQISFTNSTWNL